jgi:hypothetical protein
MNPIVAVILIICVVLLIVYLIRYTMGNSYSLQAGVRNGRDMSTFSASSLASMGSDAPAGNFAYSVWFYVNDWNYRYGQPKVLFGRMSKSSVSMSGLGVSGSEPCPLVQFNSNANDLEIYLQNYSTTATTETTATTPFKCAVSNIPIQRWVNLSISVYGRTLDVYLNGKLVKTCVMPGIAKINNTTDLSLTPNGGFEGWTSKFSFFPMPMNPQDAWDIYSKGPTTAFSSLSAYQLQVALLNNGQTVSSASF